MGYFFVEQGDVPHLFYGFDEMERESLDVAFGDFFDVTDVLFRKNDLFDARTLGRPVFFSLIPPTGSTLPRSVSSPLIANRLRILRCVKTEAIEVAIVMPAEGPSFGVAPAGTWMCSCQ